MQRLLDQPIQNRGNAQSAYPAVWLGDFHLAHRRRHPDPWPVFLKPWFERGRLKAIDPRRSLIRHDPSIRLPQVGFLHHGLHQPWRFRFRLPASRRATLRTGFGQQRVPPFTLRPGHAFTCFCFIGLHRGLSSYSRPSCSGLRQVALPTMPSADFWPFLPMPFNTGSTMANVQISPAIAHLPSRLCPSDLRRRFPYKFRALTICAVLPNAAASIRFVFLEPALCLQLPSDPRSPRTPLPFS